MINRLLLCCFVFSFTFSEGKAQALQEPRHGAMIKFLITHKELLDADTANLAAHETYMYDVVVLKAGTRPNNGVLYFFGSNSPHGKTYVALDDVKGLKLIETADMPKEMQMILDFFKRNHATSQMILKTLPLIAGAYQHNTISYKPQIEN